MTGEYDSIDVPPAGPGEAFAGDLPTVAVDDRLTEPGWVALSALPHQASEPDERAHTATGAAMAGAFIRTMRISASMSQEQLGKASSIAQSVISDIERGAGKFGPSFEMMVRLASACGMKIGFAPRSQTGAKSITANDLPRAGKLTSTSGHRVRVWASTAKDTPDVAQAAYRLLTELTDPVQLFKGRSPRKIGRKMITPRGAVYKGHQQGKKSFDVYLNKENLLILHRKKDGAETVLAPVHYREVSND